MLVCVDLLELHVASLVLFARWLTYQVRSVSQLSGIVCLGLSLRVCVRARACVCVCACDKPGLPWPRWPASLTLSGRGQAN